MGSDDFTTDWVDCISGEYSDDEIERKVQKLVNVLSKHEGDKELKLRWLRKHLTLLESEAAKQFDPEPAPQRYAAAIVSVTIRYYRKWWGSKDREMPQDTTGVRSTQPAKPRHASGSDFLREVKSSK